MADLDADTSTTPTDLEVLALLRRLVSIPSAFPEEAGVASCMADELRNAGFRVRLQEVETATADRPARCNVLAEKGPESGPAILFFGHMDTVPAHPDFEEEWVDPYELREAAPDNGEPVLMGLGTADMKAGLAAIARGLGSYEPSGSRLLVALVVDEEHDSLGVNALIAENQTWLQDVRLVISADTGAVPTQTRRDHPPVLFLTGRLGRCVFELTIPGPSGHGAYANPTRSAAMEAARLLIELDRSRTLLCGQHSVMKRGDFSVREVVAQSPAGVFSTPDSTRLLLDWMLLPGETPEGKLASLTAWVETLYGSGKLKNKQLPLTLRLQERATPYGQGFMADYGDPHVRLVAGVYEQVLETAPRMTWSRSLGDENFMASALPEATTLCLGPQGGELHTASEWVDPQAPGTAARLYRKVAEAFDRTESVRAFWLQLGSAEQALTARLLDADGAVSPADLSTAAAIQEDAVAPMVARINAAWQETNPAWAESSAILASDSGEFGLSPEAMHWFAPGYRVLESFGLLLEPEEMWGGMAFESPSDVGLSPDFLSGFTPLPMGPDFEGTERSDDGSSGMLLPTATAVPMDPADIPMAPLHDDTDITSRHVDSRSTKLSVTSSGREGHGNPEPVAIKSSRSGGMSRAPQVSAEGLGESAPTTSRVKTTATPPPPPPPSATRRIEPTQLSGASIETPGSSRTPAPRAPLLPPPPPPDTKSVTPSAPSGEKQATRGPSPPPPPPPSSRQMAVKPGDKAVTRTLTPPPPPPPTSSLAKAKAGGADDTPQSPDAPPTTPAPGDAPPTPDGFA